MQNKGLDETLPSSFLKTMNVFWFEQYKKCFNLCLGCKTTCLTTWEHCCHKETVSIKEVISSKMVTYRNGQTKASEVFNFLFGVLKSSPLEINMSVVIQETNIRKCTEKQKKSGSVGHGDRKGKARNGRVLPTCCFAPCPTSAPAKWGTTGEISSRPSALLLCYPVPLQMPPCLLREGASLVSWEAAGGDMPCGSLVTPSSGWGWQQLYKTPDETAWLYAAHSLKPPSFAARSLKSACQYCWQYVIYWEIWKRRPVLFHHGSPVKKLMMRKQSIISLWALRSYCWEQAALAILMPQVDWPLDLALCIDSRCKLNVVVAFTSYRCVISKCLFRACVKQPGIAFPWEISLYNKGFLPIFATGNPVPKAGTIVEVEVSE